MLLISLFSFLFFNFYVYNDAAVCTYIVICCARATDCPGDKDTSAVCRTSKELY